MHSAWKFDVARTRDLSSEVSALLDRDHRVFSAVHDEARDFDGWKHGTDVRLAEGEKGRRSWLGWVPESAELGEPGCECGVFPRRPYGVRVGEAAPIGREGRA